MTTSYIQTTPLEPMPPPQAMTGAVGWVRANLLSSPLNIAITLLVAYALYTFLPSLIRFFFIDAVWSGTDRDACLAKTPDQVVGACWAFVKDRISFMTYGSYPIEERWRVNIVFLMGAIGLIWMLWLGAPRRSLGALYFFVIFPICAYFLLLGTPMLGLKHVPTHLWGGILVTLVVAVTGIVAALPLGILLALGRRSKLPVIRTFCTILIEFVRGVPLITMLFMASVMLPLFLPGSLTPDKLLRALVGVSIFSAAYMAEVIRAGLQAMPKGQFEGAMAMGLSYWQMMRLIILPQALKVTLPNIMNSSIALFKDTTLVFIVGLFDFLKSIDASLVDPTWATPVTRASGYAFAAAFYFFFCYGMSRYATFLEQKFSTEHKR